MGARTGSAARPRGAVGSSSRLPESARHAIRVGGRTVRQIVPPGDNRMFRRQQSSYPRVRGGGMNRATAADDRPEIQRALTWMREATGLPLTFGGPVDAGRQPRLTQFAGPIAGPLRGV